MIVVFWLLNTLYYWHWTKHNGGDSPQSIFYVYFAC